MGFFANFGTEFNKTVEYNFFASYHGKSVCDGHAGVMKKAINQAKLEYTKIEDEESVEKIVKKLKHTDVLILTNPEAKVSECTFNGPLRVWHRFIYDSPTEVRCFLDSETNEYEKQAIKITFSSSLSRIFSFCVWAGKNFTHE